MGSDIFTEKAIAMELSDFVAKCTKAKPTRKLICDELFEEELITEDERDACVSCKQSIINVVQEKIEELMGDEGYCSCDATALNIITIVSTHGGINLERLPDFQVRSFSSQRISGYDVELDVLYIMFESYGMFETVMSKDGKRVAKELKLDEVTETEWTVHSY